MTKDNFDKVFDVVGHAGRYQYILYMCTGIVGIITGWTLTNPNFLLVTPNYRCKVENKDYSNTNFSASYFSLKKSTDKCVNQTLVNPCDQCESYEFDTSDKDTNYVNSFSVEYELICDKKKKKTLMKQTWFLGTMIGALFLSYIIDNHGRKAGIFVGELLRLVANLLIAFSHDLTLSIWYRVLVAAGFEICYKSAYIYAVEIVGTKKRAMFGMAFIFFYSCGYATLSGVAYIFQDWRHLIIFVGVASVVPMGIMFVIPESPRYSYAQKKYDEAEKALKTIAEKNGNNPDLVDINEIINLDSENKNNNESSEKQVYTALDLFTNGKRMMYVLIICIISWSGANLLYYGVTLNAAGLPFNIYVSNLCYALAEWPAAVAGVYVIEMKKLGRVRAMALVYGLCGVCLVLGSLSQKYAGCETSFDNFFVTASIIFKLFGKCLATLCFTCAFMVCAEMFPTIVRGNAMAVCSLMSRIAGAMAPEIIELGETMPLLPGFILGGVGIFCGVLILALPETRGQAMLMTFKQADEFYKKKLFKF